MPPATAQSAYKHHEDAKKYEYNMVTVLERLNMGLYSISTATVFYKRLADLLATHWGESYSLTIHWLRCCLSFALLWSAILCICGRRSSVHNPVRGPQDLSVILAESLLTNWFIQYVYFMYVVIAFVLYLTFVYLLPHRMMISNYLNWLDHMWYCYSSCDYWP